MANDSQLTFVSWARTGLAAASPPAASPNSRASVTVSLTVSPPLSTGEPSVAMPVALLGPGDAVGLDPAQVIRTDPVDGATNFEDTHFPLIEFASPYLPWLFTPTAPDSVTKSLAPWITLVVVEVQDGVALTADPAHAVSVLSIDAPADAQVELPDLTNAWAWAHVQATGLAPPNPPDPNPPDSDIATAIDSGTGCVSRLVAPRQLVAGHRYLACVVPTFAAGRAVALGETLPPGASQWAWTTERSVRLPVYHSFSFTCGPAGDFESLAQLIKGVDPDVALPPELQPDALDLSGSGLSVAWAAGDSTKLPAPTVLCFGTPARSEVPTVPSAFVTALLTELTHPAPTEPAPPVYGAVQANVSRTDAWPTWLAELNTDPRLRVAAAWGADIVHRDRDGLTAAAWAQVGDAATANRLIGYAQLASATAAVAQNRHVAPLDAIGQLQVTAPTHDRIFLQPGTTVAGWLSGKAAAWPAVVSPAYRRLTRPRGPFASAADASPPPLPMPDLQLLGAAIDPASHLAGRLWDRGIRGPAAPMPVVQSAGVATTTSPGSVSYPTAMFGRLAALNPAAVLPGNGGLPNNSVVGLQPDMTVIAAFMVGLASEMARELVWQGVPIDRGATFFQQFWQTAAQGTVPDIASIADWAHTSLLADNVGAGQAERLMLLIRADLLRRYPGTGVFAIPASDGPPQPPTLSGTLPPDTRFFAFDIPASEASQWSFAFLEQVSETRFHQSDQLKQPPSIQQPSPPQQTPPTQQPSATQQSAPLEQSPTPSRLGPVDQPGQLSQIGRAIPLGRPTALGPPTPLGLPTPLGPPPSPNQPSPAVSAYFSTPDGWSAAVTAQATYDGVHEVIVPASELFPIPRRHNWRLCSRCAGLFWAGGVGTTGDSCPAGGQHDAGASPDYALVMDTPGAPGQHDWRWCSKCAGLFWAGQPVANQPPPHPIQLPGGLPFPPSQSPVVGPPGGARTAGLCPAGGAHDASASSDYALVMDTVGAQGQHGWRWCSKCSGLLWAGGARAAGQCPAGAQHDASASSDYALATA